MQNDTSENSQHTESVPNAVVRSAGTSISSAVGASTRPYWIVKLLWWWRSCRPYKRSCLAVGTCNRQTSRIQQQCRLYPISRPGA